MEGVATRWTWDLRVGVQGKMVYHHRITITHVEMVDTYFHEDPDERPLVRYRFLRNTVSLLASQMECAGYGSSMWEWSCVLVSVD